MSIYVETCIQTSMDELWESTQNPRSHQRWDARFSTIDYVPRVNDSAPQRFDYSTRIAFGLAIHGEGESIAERDDSDRHTSSLRFWSNDPKSLIEDGAGYWQYVTTDSGIRFITAYDYKTRFGWLGRTVDRLFFRPFLGWATAWSFDRLRLWLEKGIDPSLSLQRACIHAVCRIAIALVWIYQGLFPKLIARHTDELRMLVDLGVSDSTAPGFLTAAGFAEIAFGILILVLFHSRWPLILTGILMLLATVGVVANSPGYLVAAFNPVSLNFLMIVLCGMGLAMLRELPSARHCLRKKPRCDV